MPNPGVSLCGVKFFVNISVKNEFLSKTILACLSWAQMGLIHEIKNAEKSCDTATWQADITFLILLKLFLNNIYIIYIIIIFNRMNT